VRAQKREERESIGGMEREKELLSSECAVVITTMKHENIDEEKLCSM
jgi:hypothetical protein